MGRAWGQFIILAGLAMMVHVPLRAETTTTLEASVGRSLFGKEIARIAASKELRPDKKTSGSASIVASNLALGRVVNQVQDQSGVRIYLRGQIDDEKVTVIATKPQPVDVILRSIEQSNSDLYLKQLADGSYELWDKDTYRSEAQVARVYTLQFASASDVEKALRVMITPVFGKLARHDYNNQITVYDVAEKQAEVAAVIRQLDQKLPVRVFVLSHASASEMARHLENFLQVTPRQVSADNRTRRVIVRAPEPEIRVAEQMVETFDVPDPQSAGSM